ncbi:hypothetical protein F4778DRAFT_720889 [Xylariomycetidae sp. FL2044]|nr:hypothetical protein F4778DRAFT_720889 [Xylariomycetidae sp. FL2044]
MKTTGPPRSSSHATITITSPTRPLTTASTTISTQHTSDHPTPETTLGAKPSSSSSSSRFSNYEIAGIAIGILGAVLALVVLGWGAIRRYRRKAAAAAAARMGPHALYDAELDDTSGRARKRKEAGYKHHGVYELDAGPKDPVELPGEKG